MSAFDTRPARLLWNMLHIPSVSGNEGRLASYLAERMSEFGMDSRIDEAGNVHGVIGPPDRPTVMLLGHIDTVPGNIPVCRVGDLVYGRGAVDAKGPMAAMICAAAASSGARVHVVGAVGEEVPGSVGARHVLSTALRPDAVVIGEPSGWNGVCLGYKGRIGVRYSVSQPPMHTSSPVPTAVEDAVRLFRRIQEYVLGVSSSADPIAFGSASATLVRLEGGLSRAEAFITCRVPPGFDFDRFEEYVRGHATGRVWFDERVSAVHRRRSDAVASTLRSEIVAEGGEPVMKRKAGTSDMNVLEETWRGLPMVAYGPGDAHLDHTRDEHISIGELLRSVRVLNRALPRLADLVSAGRITRPPGRALAVTSEKGTD
ncbi:M20/M25/M40 family metallo-hydrolase [Nocardiopsis valliformis]|uniref:M20/M25/M40 family metallo-hydrolase n=1 Tax=Nocardiopsis valliformis TaxID=239974 RepID=UPI000345FE74|nr:M20/M25/M40 family metallo-hydrolase [Nocardiopsis valliformis]